MNLLELADHDPDEAVRQASEVLNSNPDDLIALHVVGMVYMQAERNGLAVPFLKRIVDLRPKQSNAWSNYGLAVSGCLQYEKALAIFKEAWKIDKGSAAAANMAMCYLNMQKWHEAKEWANRALSIKPDSKSALTTLGMAKLALGDWSGFKEAKHSIGGKFRKMTQFQDEPMWEGQKVGTLVVYGEQGLGDEILYSSCIEDAKTRCDTLIIECDKRLEGLFRRSFPYAHVYGTRRQESVDWVSKYQIDASVPIGRLPEFFREKDSDFPAKPYLVADPERRIQWRALFDSWGPRPKIGIAWSGGSRHNHPQARAIGVESFTPLFELDADFVSLQYKDPTEEIEGFPVRHFKRATLTDDYDDTAALVAELDMVIGVHTSVHHLAGGLGVKGTILVPQKTIWLYGSKFPWYPAKLVRYSGSWEKTIEGVRNEIQAWKKAA